MAKPDDAEQLTLPEPGSRWRTPNGGFYTVVGVATHTETGEALVVYKSDAERFWCLSPAAFAKKGFVKFPYAGAFSPVPLAANGSVAGPGEDAVSWMFCRSDNPNGGREWEFNDGRVYELPPKVFDALTGGRFQPEHRRGMANRTYDVREEAMDDLYQVFGQLPLPEGEKP